MKKFLVLMLAVLLFGCATSSRAINRLSVGMTKDQVICKMGQPTSTAATEGMEVFKYKLHKPEMGDLFVSDFDYSTYFVRFVNGHVDSFGEMGDFDSVKDPTYNINLNQKVLNGANEN